MAKNLFLWSGRGYVRKGLEAYFTLLIEVTWPKERTLEVYLNIAQFGDGIYGVEAAVAALLTASRPRSWTGTKPRRSPPCCRTRLRSRCRRPPRYVIKRRDWILSQMRGLGGASYLHELENPTEPPKARSVKRK